jgi:adenosylcobyric acid synthase
MRISSYFPAARQRSPISSSQGWDIDLHAHVRRGGRVLGICAGYQMLGQEVLDPQRIEGPQESARGLGLLDLTTTMTADKQLRYVTGIDTATEAKVSGYEMHLGISTGLATARPMIRFDSGITDGARSADGRISGCHIHGLFNDTTFRHAFLAALGAPSLGEDYTHRIDRSLDVIALTLSRALDMHAIRDIAGLLS